jgi:hypothetical protein
MLPVVHWKLFTLKPLEKGLRKEENKNNYVACTGTVETGGQNFIAKGVIHY